MIGSQIDPFGVVLDFSGDLVIEVSDSLQYLFILREVIVLIPQF